MRIINKLCGILALVVFFGCSSQDEAPNTSRITKNIDQVATQASRVTTAPEQWIHEDQLRKAGIVREGEGYGEKAFAKALGLDGEK